MGTTNVSSQVGELFPLAFVPALAAAFGIQPVLIGSGACLIMAALLTYSHGTRIDKLRTGDRVRTELLAVADEPVSPNP